MDCPPWHSFLLFLLVYKLKYKPANAALIRFANVAAKTAFNPNCAISLRLPGASAPMPPISIAMDEKLVNKEGQDAISHVDILSPSYKGRGMKGEMMDEKLAKPHNEKITIAWVPGDKSA